jgi:hypothetical protein
MAAADCTASGHVGEASKRLQWDAAGIKTCMKLRVEHHKEAQEHHEKL